MYDMSGEAKPDVGGILNGILSNPQALSTIMSVIGGVRGSEGQGASNHIEASPAPESADVKEASASPSDALPAFSPSVTASALPAFMPNSSEKSRERDLLLALKPFLPARKCETIDTFVRLLDIVSLLGRVR